MLLSVVIPTIGRDHLERAAQSVLGQTTSAGFELIIVNDSGEPLHAAAWQQDARVAILESHRSERAVARNTGAEAARGRYLLFLDDDDWLEPGALEPLLQAAAETGSQLVYGTTRLVDRDAKPIIDLAHELSGNLACQTMCGEWIPLQSLLIDRALFHAVGAFHPWQAGAEDIDFVRRAAVRVNYHYIPEIISCVGMGERDSSTAHDRQLPLSRRGRELILDQPDTFGRMRQSAGSPRWSGGIVRIYLTSAVWNLSRLRLFRAAKRLLLAAAALLRSGRHLLDLAFWAAIRRPYRSITFEKGFAAAGKQAL